MTPDPATIDALADAIVDRLRPLTLPPGWPDGRGTLSEPETAAYLGIGAEYLRELRLSGAIGVTMQGRRVTYCVADVTEYMARCRTTGGHGR